MSEKPLPNLNSKKVRPLKINGLQRIAQPRTTIQGNWHANLRPNSGTVLRTQMSTNHPTTTEGLSDQAKESEKLKGIDGTHQVVRCHRLFPLPIPNWSRLIAFASRLGCIRSVCCQWPHRIGASVEWVSGDRTANLSRCAVR